MPFTESEKAFRIKNLQNHVRVIGNEITEKTRFLCENQVIPIKTLNYTAQSLARLNATMQTIVNTGLMMFGKEFKPIEQSKIVGMNGQSHNLTQE